MNKAFRRSLLSLTAASAMATTAFAANAAYLDVKVNYLNASGKARLGADGGEFSTGVLSENGISAKSSVDAKERAEILISVLDKDGNYATTSSDGKNLPDIELSRNGTNILTTTSNVGGNYITLDDSDNKIDRDVSESKNIRRVVLDYTDFTTDILQDMLIVKGGGIEQDVVVELETSDAKSLVLRAIPDNAMKLIDYAVTDEEITTADEPKIVNALFGDIRVSGEANALDVQSSTNPGGTAGIEIPITVYASTANTDTLNTTTFDTAARYTLAPNLEGKTIVIVPVADYNASGIAGTNMDTEAIKLTMQNGIATGTITLTRGLPLEYEGNRDYGEDTLNGGLDIAFLAYVEGDDAIANRSDLNPTHYASKNTDAAATGDNIDLNQSYTDAVQIQSGDLASIMVGKLASTELANKKHIDNIWEKTSTVVDIADLNSSNTFDRNNTLPTGAFTYNPASTAYEVKVVLTAVDKYYNPVHVPMVDSDDAELFASDLSAANIDSNITATADSDITSIKFDGRDNDNNSTRFAMSYYEDFNSSDNNRSFSAELNISTDGAYANRSYKGSGSEELILKHENGILESAAPVTLTVRSHTLIQNESTGAGKLIDAIKDSYTNTWDTANPLEAAGTNGVVPVKAGKYSNINSAMQIPEVTIQMKVTEHNTSGSDDNGTLRLNITVFDPTKDDKSTTTSGIDFTGGNVVANSGATLTSANSDKVFDLNVSGDDGTGTNYLNLNFSGSNINVGRIYFDNAITGDENLEGTSIKHTFKAYEGLNIPAYVEVSTTATEGKTVITNGKGLKPGETIDFKFSGSDALPGDTIEIEFNTGSMVGMVPEGKTALESYSGSLDNKVKVALPENKMISVALYRVNTDSVTDRAYDVSTVKVNGLAAVWKSQFNLKATSEVYELNTSDASNILLEAYDKKTPEGIAKIRIYDLDSVDANGGESDINNDAKTLSDLSTDFNDNTLTDINPTLGADNTAGTAGTTTGTTKPVTIKHAFKTDVYYEFLTNPDADFNTSLIRVEDSYGNAIDGLGEALTKLFTITCTDGMDCTGLSGKNGKSYIYFNKDAAGTEQTITLTSVHNVDVSTTITFSEIEAYNENTKFEIETTTPAKAFVENSEIIIKVAGDSGRVQEETTITVTSSNPDAKVKFIDAESSALFTSNGSTIEGIDIPEAGKFYILTADQATDVTISATSTFDNSDYESNGQTITGETKVSFINLDLVAPNVLKNNVTAIASGLRIVITEDNLDVDSTVVEIRDIDGTIKAIAEYKGNNTYEAVGLTKGRYQINILAVDTTPNSQDFYFLRDVSEGNEAVDPAEIAADAMTDQSYEITGYFVTHSFDDANTNTYWAFADNNGKVSRLGAGEKTDANPFAFGDTDATINEGATKWYLVELTGELAGEFGWALVKDDMKVAKKLEGVNNDGSFLYTKGLSLTATKTEDNKISFSK